MKYFYLIIAIGFLLCGQSCDKEEISNLQETNFLKLYGLGLEDRGIRVLTTGNGYFVIGNIENENSGQDICLIPTDKFGNTTGTIVTYGGPYDDQAYSVAPNESGYVIAGSTQRFASSEKDAFLIQIDPNGNEQWRKTFNMEGNDEAYDVIVIEDGSISLTGYIEDETGDRNILFINYDRLSGSTDSSSYGKSNTDQEAYSLTHLNGDYYFFGGYEDSKTSGQKEILLMRWNVHTPSGVFVNDENIPTANTIAREIVRGNDQHVYVACDVEKESDESEILLVKMNDEVLKSEWTSTIGERTNNTVCCLKISENSIYLSGTSSNLSETSPDGSKIIGDMMIAKIDQTGQNIEYTYRGDGESYIGAGFDFTSDGGYIITGANFVNEKSLISIFKIDPNASF